MKTIIFTCAIMAAMVAGCIQKPSNAKSPVKNVANCILIGPETMTYYYGDSSNKQELKEGSVYDHVFMSYVLTSIKNHSTDTNFKVAIKPIASADVFANIAAVIDMFNTNGIENRYVDMDDLPQYEPYKLNLPSDDKDSNINTKAKKTLTILMCGGDEIYAYEGANINGGAKYNYTNIGKYIGGESKKFADKDFIILIKPSDESTYRNTVDVLDEMKINKIDRYALVDLTTGEKEFIKTLK